MIKDMKTINLLNYNENVVVVSTKHDSYGIEPAIDSETPTILPLDLEEILYINGNSAAFKSGILRFPEEFEKELYEDYLRIPNWKELLTIKEMEDIILHPTMEKLMKLVGIKDIGTFDRLRGVFTRLKNTTDNDISMRVERIIKARAEELRRGIRNTEIVIKPKDITSAIQTEEVVAIKEQNVVLQKQMAQMQEMMERMFASQSGNIDANDDNEEVKEEPVKKPGRPKKN
ncbi:hypothetical protein [Lacrimispora sp.]|uniref:hypothetical protein n=1 Tax=Lacrimispora sp. TaxID=2719234 RepID=UPI0028A7C9C2|nr:hypothetical protein [Lacrimispora sp.]